MTHGQHALAIVCVDVNVIVMLEIAIVVVPRNSGVGNRLCATRQVHDVVIPGPSLTHRTRHECRREFDSYVAILRHVAT